MKSARCRKGFSFVEILISIVLVGLSITALVVASSSFTQANATGADLSTAEFLIEQIRERTAVMPFDELPGLDDTPYPTPIDAHENELTALSAFSQHVAAKYVDPSDFTAEVTGPTAFVRVTVTVALNGRPISSASWIRANYEP